MKLKAIFVSVGALVALVLAALVIYSTGQRKSYLTAKGEAAVLEKQFADYRLEADKAKAILTAEFATLTAEKNAALTAALNASLKAGEIQARLDAEQALTAALPADVLSGRINARIGVNQSVPIMNGTFSFTRPGTESTLNIFLEGEASASKYAAERTVTASLRDAVNASEKEVGNLGQRLYISETELDKAVAAWGADKDALKHLERSILGTKIKNLAIGAGAGVVIVTVLHLTGIVK